VRGGKHNICFCRLSDNDEVKAVELPAGMRPMTDEERKEQANMVLEALEKQACL
jgi:hypothetical protein